MNYFLNYENGELTIDSYRHPMAVVTTVEDILESKGEEDYQALTASLGGWVDDKINDMWGKVPDGLDESELTKFVFIENNFTEVLVDAGINPDNLEFMWEAQHDFIDDYLDE